MDFVAPKVAAEIEGWLRHLGDERRMSPKTVEAYRRDVLQFLGFLAEHLGGAPSLKELAALAPADVRAFLAARRAARYRQPLADARARRRARLRPLSRTQRQGQGRRARRRAGAENRQDPAAAAGVAAAKSVADPDLAAGDEREPWIACPRRRRAGVALRLRPAHLRSARA